MREVSVRMLHLYRDLARLADLDEPSLLSGLPSVVLPDGADPDWIDWDDYVEVVERFERLAGGPEGVGRIVRMGLPSAFPELRAFAAVFVRPVPFFAFVMTRLAGTMYRHMAIEKIERLDADRVRWTQTIPDPYRASAAFHRCTIPMVQVFPRHLDLAEATIESASISARTAAFVLAFPPAPSLTVRGAHVSAAASVLAAQLDEAFAHIGATLRAKPGTSGTTTPEDTRTSAPPAPRATTERGFVHDWAERLVLSPRQRDVFSLLVEGRANKDIAAVLRCSERNIEFHVGRILRSASVSSRAELLVKVLGARP
jgi:DNA-binding CsgD family transcriptional regulator